MRISTIRRKQGTSGRTLETLVMASQVGVTLTKVGQDSIKIRDPKSPLGFRVVPVKGPCDFFGCFDGGRMLIFDAKEGSLPNRLQTSTDHLSEKQRLELLRYADAGAVAGLLCLCRANNWLYWCPAKVLQPRMASVPWEAMTLLAFAGRQIRWDLILEATEAQL